MTLAEQGRPVAIVTGAARGLGRAIAQELSGSYRLALTHFQTTPEAEMEEGGNLVIHADLSDPEAPQEVIWSTMAQFGRIDLIVHNAGIIASDDAGEETAAAARARLHKMFDVNLFAAQGLLTAALPHLKPGAAVVSVSSVNAVLPPMGAAFYGASKAALELWTRGMAKELGPQGVRVNAVAPGAIEDPAAPRPPELVAQFEELTALGKLASPSDVAAAVRFLASDAAQSITGEVLTVSGGYRL